LPPTKTLDLRTDITGKPLAPGRFTKGFEYSDCTVDDARLVILNARDAADRGAEIRTRTRAIEARQHDGLWHIKVEDTATGKRDTISARVLINAAGPWVHEVLAAKVGVNARANVRLVQGSHIVVPKLYDHDRAYILQNADGRIVFAIPYRDDYTLIGTTDGDFDGDPATARATAEEIDYLCASVSDYFAKPVKPADVVWTYSGVRPLYDDGASEAKAATRDYVFELDVREGAAPVLSVFGGKITTYRKLSEEVLERIAPYLPKAAAKGGWTGRTALPGGEFDVQGLDALIASLQRDYPFLSRSHAKRLARAYGTLAEKMLGEASSLADLGKAFGASLTEREVRYLMAQEWACTADDIVWRRSKLGLRMSANEIAALEGWIEKQRGGGGEVVAHEAGVLGSRE
jgi:glycerol-3-phosphate dehydrogenase